MATYKNNKMEVADIHGGVEYVNGQSPDVNDFNKLVEGIGYATEIAEQVKSTPTLYSHELQVKNVDNGNTGYIRFLSNSNQPVAYKNDSVSYSTDYFLVLPNTPLTIMYGSSVISYHVQIYYDMETIVYIDSFGETQSDTIEYDGGTYNITEVKTV